VKVTLATGYLTCHSDVNIICCQPVRHCVALLLSGIKKCHVNIL